MTNDAWPRTDLVALLTERARRHPERLALRFLHDGEKDETVLTYGALHARACTLAAHLTRVAAPGDRALLLYPSGPEYVTALLACFYAGIVAVPAFPPQSLQAAHMGRVLSIARDAQPSLLLTQESLLAKLSELKGALVELSSTTLVATDGLEPKDPGDWQPGALAPDATAMLQYTSGSTSTPKGVVLTHDNLMANEAAIQAAFSIQPDDVIVSWLPLFHDMGLIGTLLQPLYSGVSAVLMAPQRFMERPQRWLEAISRYGGTVSGAPDFAYRLCAQRVDPTRTPELRLDTWRLAFCGAEPVRAPTLRAFVDRFAATGFAAQALYPCYGLAEATLLVTGGSRGEGIKSQRFSVSALRQNRAEVAPQGQELVNCGAARPGHRLLIADPESGQVRPAGVVGEIQVSGPSIARGYFQNREATERTFIQRAEGVYLRTGDLGFLHAGELFVVGRHKELIIVRGQNIYPQDVERSIEEQNEIVRKGRVVAFALEDAGEESLGVAAEVSPRLQKLIEPQAVCRAISELVAREYGEPPRVVLLLNPGAVQVTSSGKLQRAATRDAWLDRSLSVFASYGHPVGQPRP